MSRSVLAAMLALALGTAGRAQEVGPPACYRLFDGEGAPVTLDAVVEAALGAEVLLLGEQHDDAAGHALRLELVTRLGAALPPERRLVLALEMFERDVQPVLDEYAAGLVRERDLLAVARPWTNYAEAYRPLVERALGAGWPVVAANVPGRYANLVAREGIEALARLPGHARAWLPPLPVEPPSEPLAGAFRTTMARLGEAHGGHGLDVDRLLAAQNLRDATMAYSVAEALERHAGALVVLLAGAFHTEGGLGVAEHLARYAPGVRVLGLTARPLVSFPELDTTAFRPGDAFVAVTAPEGC